ncbi:MAG: BREX-1 system phosphatase PglZ type A [Desulfobulbaceae bacterium]|nr:BREX-1 system phosphatase PglZ type A [Pseudomonadota bacterium]MCG2747626.1 BREX-1 system phosphatase PglZ type A [Desulfobulbaceae bacterium]
MSNIQDPLTRLFKKHRIVFWYDTDKDLRADYESLDLPSIEKIELDNNEFNVKHRILRDESNTQFLLYHEGPQPADLENWLLDVLLSQGEFRTDQASIFLGELGLGPEFSDLVRGHLEFFNNAKRREKLKELLRPDDTPGTIRTKMLAVCSCAEPRVDVILENFLGELASNQDEKFNLIQRCGLDGFLWEQLNRYYGYESTTKSIRDFVIELFESCYRMELNQPAALNSEAVIFLKRWKDSTRHRSSFESLSEECADALSIEHDLQNRDYKSLIDVDYFRLIDLKIIRELVRSIADRTLSTGECAVFIRNRRQSHWYQEYSHHYESVEYAARFIQELETVNLQANTLSTGIDRYSNAWYRVDQLYRKFIYHSRKSGQASLLEKLSGQIEDLYTNSFLLQMNDNWQQVVDACQSWKSPLVPMQKRFYEKWVSPYPAKNKKVCVIISDALRYEIGEELLRLIRREDRYEAQLEPMLGMLPSFTQLGMASLLPNKELRFADKDSATILVDGVSSLGTANRSRILGNYVVDGATAIRADDFLNMNKDDSRELFRENSVVYIYHNRIDATGDKKQTEEQVFEAVEETLQELIKVIKKLATANATNMLITSDHGFIYQNKPLDESDFTSAEPQGEIILHRDRRFIVGKGLQKHTSLRYFTAEELGLAGDVEIQISKSINRMRLKGSGSRYVHGGASLQEVVLPVLMVNKKRQSDVSSVEVDILRSGSTVITSSQLSVAFYQIDPVTGKRQSRTLRAGIYNKDGELISDSHELIFDFTSNKSREREIQVRFLLTRNADDVNGQTVTLKLEEKLPGTAKYKGYKSVSYTMQRSFTTDFDF